MIPYEGFKERYYPTKKKWEDFSEEELMVLKRNLPLDVIDFLREEGLASYCDNFLWTTLPDVFHEILTAWGIKGENCFALMRTAIGACIYFHRKEFFYLDPIFGRIVSMGDDFYMLLNIFLKLEVILNDGFFEDKYKNIEKKPKLLQPDQMYAFVPAIPLGGSFESSKVEIVKMKEHLFFLSQLFEGKARRI